MCNRNRNDSIGRLDECHSLLRQLVDKHFCWISGWRLTGKKCWCEHKTEIQVSVTFNVTQWHESMRQIPFYDWQIRCDDRVTCVALSFLMFRYAQRWMESFSSSQRAYQNTIQTGNAPTTTCKYVLFFLNCWGLQRAVLFVELFFFNLTPFLGNLFTSKAGGSSQHVWHK